MNNKNKPLPGDSILKKLTIRKKESKEDTKIKTQVKNNNIEAHANKLDIIEGDEAKYENINIGYIN